MPESDRDKTLEVMARGIYEAAPLLLWDESVKTAQSLLAHLQAEGMAVVPVEPTQAMGKAGYEACCNIPRTGVVPENIERAYDCWVAMLAASPYGKAFQPMGSAEAQRAVAHMGSEKEKDDA